MPSPRLASVLAGFVLASLTLCAFPGNAQANICTRTAAVQTGILAEITGVSNCANVTSTHLASITGTLDLSSQSITSLQAGDFSGLTNLRSLDLNANQLSTLPAGVFTGLTKLRSLYLSANQLSTLPAGVFTGLTSLRGLLLNSNQLSTLPAGVFTGLTNLTSLWLRNNRLSTLPAGVFTGLTNLTWLNLRSNQLSTLPAGVFTDLTSLTTLFLDNNQLSSLPAGAFTGLTSLTTLRLDNNQLSSLPSGVFTDLTSLTTLRLEDNQLSTLPAGAFTGLSSVTRLELRNNRLSTLPAGVFTGLTNLTTLRLEHNRLSTLPAGAFTGLTSLRGLRLEHNLLSTLPAGVFTGLTSLTGLNLDNNGLRTLPAGVFTGLTSLTGLNLDNNGLRTLPAGVFTGLTSLRSLNLDNNQLRTLSAGAFTGLASLTQLRLDNNQLSTLPAGVFTGLTSVRVLYLGGNQLSTLPAGVFTGLSSLSSLRLENNQLRTLPAGVFTGLASLTQLHLQENLVDPFTLTMEPEQTEPNTFVVKVREAAPFTMTTTLGVSGGTLSATSVRVEAGSTTSTSSITATPGSTDPLVVTLGTAPSLPDPDNFLGLQILVGGPLILTPGVTVSPTSVTPDEGASEDYTVVLNTKPSASVTITVTRETGGDTDLTVNGGDSLTLTFTPTNWDSEQAVTIAAADDNDAVHGTATFTHTATSTDSDYDGITIDPVTATEVDDDQAGLTVSFEVSAYSTIEGVDPGVTVTVSLNKAPEARALEIPIKVTGGTAETTDYGVTVASPHSWDPDTQTGTLSFAAGDSSQTFTVTATDDDDLDDETVVLGFGTTSLEDVTAGTLNTTTVTLVDDDRTELTVSFVADAYTATENGADATVTVTLDQAADRPLEIPIKVTGGTAGTTDYGVTVGNSHSWDPDTQTGTLSFGKGEQSQTFTVTATDDTDLDDETVVLGFGTLPEAVTAVTPDTTTVALVDVDRRGELTVSFEVSAYSTIEGADPGVTVTVSLNKAPEAQALEIPLKVTGGTAGTTDYGVTIGNPPNWDQTTQTGMLSFGKGEQSQTFTVTATDDTDLDDETVVLGFGDLPAYVSAGATDTTTVTLVDDDRTELKVSFAAAAYTATENGADATVTVTLAPASDRPLEIPIKVTGGTAGTTDYGVTAGNSPSWDPDTQTGMLSFAVGDSSQTFTVAASNDTLVEVNETVRLGFGLLPADVTAGTPDTTTVTLVDDDRVELTVSFGAASYTATENGTVATVTVTLAPASDRPLEIPLKVTGGTAETTDYGVTIGNPPNWNQTTQTGMLSFGKGDSSQTFTVEASNDTLVEVNETVVLGFGTLPPDVTEGTLATTTVTLVDDDRAELTVSFGAASYTATENGTAATVTVTLAPASDRPLEIPLEVTGGTAETTDYGVTIGNPPNWNQTTQTGMLSFGKGDSSQTFTVEASNDTLVEVNETVVLGFGTLPPDVTEGTLPTTTVTLVDDDRAALRVSFGADAYTATEGEADGVTVTVSLDQAANRPLTIPLKTDPASGDFTLSVTEVGFTVGEQSQTFTVTATDDADLDDETVMLRFGDLTRSAVTEGKPAEAMLTIIDDEGAVVRARFRRLNDEILSKQALTLADVTIAAVTSRMDAGACAGQPNTVSLGGSSTLAEILTANAQTLNTGRLNLKQLLGTSSFRLRLTEDGSGAGPGCLTLWGQGDYRNLSSSDAQGLEWDGDLLTGQVGADALLQPDLRAGLAVSWSDGAFDYTDRTTGMPISGDYSSRMVSVHPYVTWWSPMGLDLWATGGYGRGEIEIEDEEVGTHTSDTTLRLASVGASGPLPIGDALIAGGTTTLRLKAQASVAQMDVAGHGSLLQEQTIEAQRLRLALEGSHERPLASGGSLTPSLEVGLRHDGGDGATGTGLELGGGLRYVNPALGLTVEGRGRVLAAYEEDYEEWGASGLIRLDPGLDRQGLSFSLVPSYGQTASGVQRLWDQGLTQGSTQGPSPTQAPTGRLEAEVGYGLAAFAGQGLVTPYSAVILGGGTQQYRVGSRLELGPELRLSLEGTRQVTTVGQANQGIRLQVDWQF